jgi:DnaJ-domain-containing protein 1
MSFTRKIIDGAMSGLSQLTELVVVDDEPLSHVDGAALEAELAARKASRARRARAPADNPLARLAMPGARADRERQARDREGRIHRERSEREAKQKAAADEAFRRVKEQAARGPAPGASYSAGGAGSAPGSGSYGAGSSTGPRPGAGRPPRPGSEAAQVAEWYKALDLQPGADLATVKSAYRKLMRKYHPDLHAGNPQKQKAATELSMRVTSAYNALSTHLEKK